jgi:NitT/TauT family transport system ATP-binding protein
MMLGFSDLGHSFLGRSVFEHFSLAIAPGEVVALLGPSGCGKTTILHIAAGLIDPARGEVRRACRRHGVVFQDPRLLPWMTARDNIAYGLAASRLPRRRRHAVAGDRAAEVGLALEDLDKYPVELSGGMRQRAAIARALAVEPDLLLFDEPFSALDVGLKRAMQDLVIEATTSRGAAALFVTHDLSEAMRVAHRLVLLSGHGGILVDEPIPGRPGERSDRDLFDMVEARATQPAFAELFDTQRLQ